MPTGLLLALTLLLAPALAVDWIAPTNIAAHADGATTDDILPPEIVTQWRQTGVAIVDGLLPPSVVDEAVAAATTAFPPPPPGATVREDFGNGVDFPSLHFPALNAVTLHPRVLAAVRQLLGQYDIRLSQSDVWAKVGAATNATGDNNRSQRMHADFPNHSLVHPPGFDNPEVVAAIVYYSDVEEAGGGTAFVARNGTEDEAYRWPFNRMPGFGSVPYMNDRGRAEAYYERHNPELAAFRERLYTREQRVQYRKGTVLLYRHDVWHRGTEVTVNETRRVHNLVFKRAGLDHINSWNVGTARSMYSPELFVERLIAEASPSQRAVLGFPDPGDAYWTPDTLSWVMERYGMLGFDPAPYAEGMQTQAVARAEL